MSEKHLTETAWKVVVSKTQIKDNAMQKALQTYSKVDAAKDLTHAFEALDEINLQAAKLRKANSSNKELANYLDEVIKEAHKTKSSLANPTKSQGPEAETLGEQHEETDDTHLKGRLISALKKVRTGDGQVSLGFLVCVAKPCYGISLARSANEKIGPSHKKELAQLTKGTKFIQGKCIFEKEAHTFVVETVPAGLARNLKSALKEYTGLTYKIRVRDLEGKTVADGDSEVDLDDNAASVSEIPSAPPLPTIPGGPEMATFTARFKALQPEIVKAIATRTAQGDEIKRRAVEAGALASKKDFPKANQMLELVESLLKKSAEASKAKASAPTPQANGAFQKAWLAATANLFEAVDTVQRQLADFAASLMASGEENLIWIAEEGLSQVFSPLRDAAITIDRATSKLPARVAFKSRPAIELLKRQITTPRVVACDQNKLGVTVTIRETISKAIQELEAALKLAQA